MLGEPQVVAITAELNLRSQAVMHRLGMRADASRGFEHPRLPKGHPLRPHRLFAIDRPATYTNGPTH